MLLNDGETLLPSLLPYVLVLLQSGLFRWHQQTWLIFPLDILSPLPPSPARCFSFLRCLCTSWFPLILHMMNYSKKGSSDGISCLSNSRKHQKPCEKTISHDTTKLIIQAQMAGMSLDSIRVSIWVLGCLPELLILLRFGYLFQVPHKLLCCLLCFFSNQRSFMRRSLLFMLPDQLKVCMEQ